MVMSGLSPDADSIRAEGRMMTDQSTSENPDAVPTQAIELADQQPVAQDAPSTESASESSAQEPEKAGGRHTRTILEIIGAAAAVVLIAAAAAGGFAAGLAVSDDGPRGFAIEHIAEERQGTDGYGQGKGRGFDGGDMGRGHGEDQGFGRWRGEMGRGEMGRGEMGRGEMGRGHGESQGDMGGGFEGGFGQEPGRMQQG